MWEEIVGSFCLQTAAHYFFYLPHTHTGETKYIECDVGTGLLRENCILHWFI